MDKSLPDTPSPGPKQGKGMRRTNVEKWALEVGRVYRLAKKGKLPIDQATRLTYIARTAGDLWAKVDELQIGADLAAQLEARNG